jgi:hypothetical protein
MAVKTEHKDFIHYILKQREKKNEVSDAEVLMNAALFMYVSLYLFVFDIPGHYWLGIYSVAGSETTATLLSGLTNHLLRNPEIFDRLKKEIRTSVKKEEDIVIANLINLPFLNACIEEGLRIFPPVPVGLLRVVPAGGSDIDGNIIPEGVSLSNVRYDVPSL